MNQVYSTTDAHKKGKHLTYEDRVLIQIRLKDKQSSCKIAKVLGCGQILSATKSNVVQCSSMRIVSNGTRLRQVRRHMKRNVPPVAASMTGLRRISSSSM